MLAPLNLPMPLFTLLDNKILINEDGEVNHEKWNASREYDFLNFFSIPYSIY